MKIVLLWKIASFDSLVRIRIIGWLTCFTVTDVNFGAGEIHVVTFVRRSWQQNAFTPSR